MAGYGKSKTTQERIIGASEKLFWEKGYARTRYEDITAEAEVNAGLIYYHFKTKDALGGIAYRKSADNAWEECQKAFQVDDPMLLCALHLRSFWKCIDASPEFARFNQEIALERIPSKVARISDIAWVSYLNDRCGLGLTEKEIKLVTIAVIASDMELILASRDGNPGLSPGEYADFDLFQNFSLLGIDRKKIGDITAHSRDMCGSYSFKVLPHFVMKFRAKKSRAG